MLSVHGPLMVIDLFWDRFRSDARRKKLQQKRFHRLIDYVRTHSPYYAKALADLPRDFTLQDLPVMSKPECMRHFDEIVTDQNIRLTDIKAFMQDPANRKRKYLDQYAIATTSGSTGVPLTTVFDKHALALFVYMGSTRLIPSYRQFIHMLLKGFKIANLVSDRGFFLGNAALHQNVARVKNPNQLMRVFDILAPIDQLVEELNDYQPLAMHCYPSILESIVEEKVAGRLRIEPMMILCGGEKLTADLRQRAEAAFGVKVYGNYSCTEAGSIGYECTEQRLHINEDWLILEPVDEQNQPVAPGETSHKILITHLGNYTMPFIRYEVSDQVCFDPTPCPCGKRSPTIRVEGRTGAIIELQRPDGSRFKISYIPLITGIKDILGVEQFQVVAYRSPDNRMDVRLRMAPGFQKSAAFEQAAQILERNVELYQGPSITPHLANEEPSLHPRSGKFSPAFQVDKEVLA